MAKRPEGYWKKYYEDHREQRLADSMRYQREHSAEKKAYLKEWYRENKDKVDEYRKQNAHKRREKARERYATDPAYRELKKQEVNEYRKRKPSVRWASQLKRFGLTLDDYDRMLEVQSGGCAICGGGTGDKRTKRFHVDHCHSTGKVRGLLCSNCNLAIGKFKDDPALLEKSAMYLRLSVWKAEADYKK